MSYTIHQALFGQDQQHGQGYELLKTTHPNLKLVQRMGNSTDLIENVPSQIKWQPALRGRSWEEYYLLFKTYPDTSPDVRPGRVFSHTLLIERRCLVQLSDIRPLLKQFPSQLTKNIALAPLVLRDLKAPTAMLTPRLGSLLKELITPTRSGPIIWAGQDGFEEAAALLWQSLGVAERQNASFNVGFMPHQLRDTSTPLQLIAVPETMLPRWRGRYFVIETTDAHIDLTEAEAYLAGDTTRSPHLSALLMQLGVPPQGITQLGMLQRVAPTAAALDQASLQEVLTLATILYWYQQMPSELSQQTLARLVQLIQQSDVTELSRLRSLTDTMLSADALQQLAVATSKQLPRLVADALPSQVTELLAWKKVPERQWWRRSLHVGIEACFKSWNAATSELVVSLLEQPVSLVDDYLSLLPTTQQIEDSLLSSLPTSWSSQAWKHTASIALSRQWLRLHMMCLLRLFPVFEALQQHLTVNTSPTNTAALQISIGYSKPKEFIAAAALLNDDRITQLAANLCVKQPALMRKIQLAHAGWQAIWLAVAKQTRNIWTGIEQPATIVTKLLDQLLTGTVLTELITMISASPQSDIRNYVHRSAIWTLLPDNARVGFLRSTAIGLLTYESPEESTSELEPELVRLFNSSAFQTEAFYHPSMSLGRVIVYSKRFTVSEPVVLQYLRAYRDTPAPDNAQAFGQLVLQKQWNSIADEIFSYSRWNSAWQVALAECVSLLGMINRFVAYLMPGLSMLPSRYQLQDSWWKSLQAELQSVYYEGPLQDGLWEESGGENHEIKAMRTGGEQWVDALRKLRTRKTQATIELLLEAVTMHYPTNSTFTTLRRNIDHA